jgi:hypothetical protein
LLSAVGGEAGAEVADAGVHGEAHRFLLGDTVAEQAAFSGSTAVIATTCSLMSLTQFGPQRRDLDFPAMGNFQVATHRGACALRIA